MTAARQRSTSWIVVAFLAGIVTAWAVAPTRSPSPWSPVPSPHETRPILAGLVRLAKTVGWFMVFAEQAPAVEVPVSRVAENAEPNPPPEVGDDGYAVLQNNRGW